MYALVLFFLTSSSQGFAIEQPERASGKNQIPAFPALPHLIAYDELMELDETARIHYIKQLQLLIADVADLASKNGNSTFADAPHVPSGIEKLVTGFLDEAHADDSPSGAQCDSGQPKEHVENTATGERVKGVWACKDLAGNGYLVRRMSDGRFSYERDPASAMKAIATLNGVQPQASVGPASAKDPSAATPDTCVELDTKTGGVTWKTDARACDRQAKTDDKGRKLLKEAASKKQFCILAGNAIKKESNGKCRGPTSICKDTLAPPTKQDGSCDDRTSPWVVSSDKVICNPALFGIMANDLPFSVKRHAHATRHCIEAVYKYEQLQKPGVVSPVLELYGAGATWANPETPSSKSSLNLGAQDSNERRAPFADSTMSSALARLDTAFQQICPLEGGLPNPKDCSLCLALRPRLAGIRANAMAAARNKGRLAKLDGGQVNCPADAGRPIDMRFGFGPAKEPPLKIGRPVN